MSAMHKPIQRRFSLKDLCASLEKERRNSTFANEQVDQSEINRIFAARKTKRSNINIIKKPQTPLRFADPEQKALMNRLLESKDVLGLDKCINGKLLGKDTACAIWGDMLGVPHIEPFQSIVAEEAIALIPKEIALKALVLPLYAFDDVLTVAMADPSDTALVSKLSNIADYTISPVFSLPSEIKAAIEIHYAASESIEQSILSFENQHGAIYKSLKSMGESELAESKPIELILDSLLHLAIRERASDIHLEPFEDSVRIRLRVDGKLREIQHFSHAIHRAVGARVRVLCKLNIAEYRFPQDGRFSLKLGGVGNANFRVSIRPVSRGSNIVIRLLSITGKRQMMTLDNMLISSDIIEPYRRIVRSPNGLVFVTGPTGSGKTTLLYATLQEINNGESNITTIEDPIEVEIPGIAQSQVNPHIDLSFAFLLRSILRQDPDVILVGEIRDLETARIATEAALTGHLVFSTLHTSSAIQAVVRLIEIGIDSYMVAPSINAVVAQRLAPRLNPRYREPYIPPKEILSEYFHDWQEAEGFTFYRPRPDDEGRKYGFRGRIAFHELVLVSDKMRSLISSNAGLNELIEAAEEMGYRPLRHDGFKKALLGLTTLEEITNATPQGWEASRHHSLSASSQ